ncbi:MAG TPA: hypothetical protein VLY23_16005 [Candidatus Acidoferrum sp.]|nr:hypothetical protein [Candidatus Acidoferrum sp.]
MTRQTYVTGILAVAALIGASSLIGTNAFSQQQAASTAPQTGTAAAPQATAPSMKGRKATDAEFVKESKAALARSAGRGSPRVRNPKAVSGGISATMLSTLQAQKMAADTEHTQALAAMHTQSASGQPGAGSTAQPSSQPGTNPPAAGMATVPPKTTTAMRTTTPTGVGPEKTMGGTTPTPAGTPPTSVKPATGGASVAGTPPTSVNPPSPARNRYTAAPAQLTTAICREAGIGTVNGKTKGTVFTPTQDYNLYTIKGCYFGSQPGQAYIFGPFKAQRLNLQIDFWTDGEIDARLDPNVSGEVDQNNNVTLVVAPKGAAELKATGFSFYAAREVVFLSTIPQSWAKLADMRNGPLEAKLEYTSPIPSDSQGAGSTALVYRYLPDNFGAGVDYYLFEKLAAGWTSDSAQLFTYDSNECSGIVTYKQSFGSWDIEWVNDDIRVTFASTVCSGFWPPPPLPPVWWYENRTVSTYSLKMWVNGPRGTTP